MNTDWKQIIRTVAPALATALGGPLAGMAAAAISEAALGNPDGGIEEISAAVLKGGPEMLARIKEAEINFRVKMKELEIDLEKIAAGDRASARDREKALKDRTPAALAAGVFAGFFGILAALTFMTIPEASLSPLNIMLGALATIVVQVTAYYFGSSAGSAAKSRTLEGVLKRPGE